MDSKSQVHLLASWLRQPFVLSTLLLEAQMPKPRRTQRERTNKLCLAQKRKNVPSPHDSGLWAITLCYVTSDTEFSLLGRTAPPVPSLSEPTARQAPCGGWSWLLTYQVYVVCPTISISGSSPESLCFPSIISFHWVNYNFFDHVWDLNI